MFNFSRFLAELDCWKHRHSPAPGQCMYPTLDPLVMLNPVG